MTIVYGSQVEPGGMELDDDSDIIECPNCGQETAISRYWEACEGGSINQYHSLYCPKCGHSEGDGNDDESIIDFIEYHDEYQNFRDSYEIPIYDTLFVELSRAVDARCELALARTLASTNVVASVKHLKLAYSIAFDEGRSAFRNGRNISPLMAKEPFLLKSWEAGVSVAK